MSTYSDYKKSFNDELLLLGTGLARIKKRRKQNWYQNLKDYVNSLAGGWAPSLDPGISKVKSETNIWSGAEAMNKGARKILDSTISEYRTIYTQHFAKFYNISEQILQIKKGDNFSFENEFSSDENLDKIKQLFIRLRTSDDTEGLVNENAPRNLVIKIFEELTNIINLLSKSVSANYSSLNSILNDLENNQLSDHLEGPLIEVCKQIYIFGKFSESFTMAQAHRRGERRLEPIATPTGSRGESTGGGGRSPGALRSFDYSAEGFSEERATSLENIGRDRFRLSSLGRDGDGWNIPIILSRKDGESISSEEVEKINNEPIQFINHLISLGVLEPVNIGVDLVIRNTSAVTARPSDDGSKLQIYIELNKAFKEEAYNEVLEDGAVIFQINDTNTASPAGFVVKAHKGDSLLKEAETATTPYYETVSPSGEKVRFTPSDLVKGMGKLKDSSGKTFKPKKIKGKSLADKVMSKNFGKIRK